MRHLLPPALAAVLLLAAAAPAEAPPRTDRVIVRNLTGAPASFQVYVSPERLPVEVLEGEYFTYAGGEGFVDPYPWDGASRYVSPARQGFSRRAGDALASAAWLDAPERGWMYVGIENVPEGEEPDGWWDQVIEVRFRGRRTVRVRTVAPNRTWDDSGETAVPPPPLDFPDR